MKNLSLITVFALSLLFVIGCEKEDEDNVKPTVSNLEVGYEDTLHVGEPVHLEFDAEDNDALDYYRVVIHFEGGHEHKSADEYIEWDFDTTFYDNFTGLKNATVHHHYISVPENAEEGDYHFHLTVADKAGNTTEIEKELIMTVGDGHEHE